jgi:aryl-alcohol dehydrogenase-like predicted oxidoreductase
MYNVVNSPISCTALRISGCCCCLCADEAPDYSAGRVRASIQASMQRLGLSYIDILHCHDIEFCPDMRQVRVMIVHCKQQSPTH